MLATMDDVTSRAWRACRTPRNTAARRSRFERCSGLAWRSGRLFQRACLSCAVDAGDCVGAIIGRVVIRPNEDAPRVVDLAASRRMNGAAIQEVYSVRVLGTDLSGHAIKTRT